MKKLILLSILLMSACGGGSGQGPDVVYITDEGEPGESAPSVTNKPTTNSHESSFGDTAPIPGMGKSARFDENGSLIGVYEVPYVPSKDNK